MKTLILLTAATLFLVIFAGCTIKSAPSDDTLPPLIPVASTQGP